MGPNQNPVNESGLQKAAEAMKPQQGSYKSGSTARMMKTWAKDDLKIPARIKPNSIDYLDLAITNATMGQCNSNIKSLAGITAKLSNQKNESADLLTLMQNSNDTRRIASSYQQRHLPLADSSERLTEEQKSLLDDAAKTITAMRTQLVDAFAKQKDIKEPLAQLKKAQEGLRTRIGKVGINGENLANQFEQFSTEVRQIMIAAGVSPAAGKIPTMGGGQSAGA